MYRFTYLLLVCLLGISGITVETAFAHGVTASTIISEPVSVHFEYAGGDPMSYASVLVFAPNAKKTDAEFQNGRTDAKGNFAFIPDKTGTWSISAEDMGHRAELRIPVTKAGVAQPSSTESGASKPLRIILGLSLILNLLCAALFVKCRKVRGQR
ncbi:hypothetical protein [Halodesulfovibrio sp.]|jgi:nickel transport protein|uniref:hypothetical protein n=1 Tax=Halodesulfovibrio sp. TaxID=1912772 RepID=UPI0025CC21C3|nr:hypothetical protein [Halodesulfovibrio sp.]MCT4536023.1 DUF4198 domain-containing protein [Halodesulfovibrio sp.]